MSLGRVIGLFVTAVLSAAASVAAQVREPAPAQQTLVFGVGRADGKSAECVVSFGPAVPISAVAFSPDGKTLAAGGYKEVLLWDLAAAKLAKRIGAGQLAGRVGALAFLGNGPMLAVGDGVPGKSGAVRILDSSTGALARAFQEPPDEVRCLAVSADGALLAAGGACREVHVWGLKDGKLVQTIKGHEDWVEGVCFSPDGQLLATASADKTLQIWNVSTWERTLRASHGEALHGVAFSPDSKSTAATVGGPGERAVHIRRNDSPRSSQAVATGEGMPLGTLWPQKGNRLYAACSDKTVKAIGVYGGVMATFQGHTDWVYAVASSADGSRLASGSADGTVRLWNAADGKLLATLVQLAPRSDQWLIMTAQGYLATSSPDALRWQTKDLATEGLTAKLQNPESVRKALAGEKLAPPTLE